MRAAGIRRRITRAANTRAAYPGAAYPRARNPYRAKIYAYATMTTLLNRLDAGLLQTLDVQLRDNMNLVTHGRPPCVAPRRMREPRTNVKNTWKPKSFDFAAILYQCPARCPMKQGGLSGVTGECSDRFRGRPKKSCKFCGAWGTGRFFPASRAWQAVFRPCRNLTVSVFLARRPPNRLTGAAWDGSGQGFFVGKSKA